MKGWIAFIVIVGLGGAYFAWPRTDQTNGDDEVDPSGAASVVHAAAPVTAGDATVRPQSETERVGEDRDSSSSTEGPAPGQASGSAASAAGLSSVRLSGTTSPNEDGRGGSRGISVAELRDRIAADPAGRKAASARLELARRNLAEGRSEEASGLLMEAVQSGADLAGLGEIYLGLASLTPEKDEERCRLLYSKAVEMGGLKDSERTGAWARLKRLNDRLVFSKRHYSKSFEYEIQPGDSLWKITRRLRKKRGIRITTGMLQAINEMGQGTVIQPGRRLKVIQEPLRILVEKRRFKLTLFLGDCILEQHNVGLGRNDCTPEGDFTVANRLVDPPWINNGRIVPFGHKDNVLGTRWLGFEATQRAEGLGIHGTWDPQSIGKEMSNGCVRMLNQDVEELFKLVPVGTPVQVRL